MAKDKIPVTPAVRVLRAEKVEFTPHLYAYEDKGGTAVCARELGFPEHTIIKTLVMEDDQGNPLLILMHGDQQVSTRELARILGVKNILPCSAEKASRSDRLSGGRHLSLRHQACSAGLHGGNNPRPSPRST